MIWHGTTPKGVKFSMNCREGTSDANICTLIALQDEYHLASFDFDHVAIDVGAHIGAVTVPLLIDNPELRVVAVEPVFENLIMLRKNIEENGVGDRATVLPIACGEDEMVSIRHGWKGRHRHIGNLDTGGKFDHADQVLSMPLSRIRSGIGSRPISLLKLDCEGCEWQVLADPAIAYCERIVGEFHDQSQKKGGEHVQHLLINSHAVSIDGWTFTAVLL